MSNRWFTLVSCLLPWLFPNARAATPALVRTASLLGIAIAATERLKLKQDAEKLAVLDITVPRASRLATAVQYAGFFGEQWEFTRP